MKRSDGLDFMKTEMEIARCVMLIARIEQDIARRDWRGQANDRQRRTLAIVFDLQEHLIRRRREAQADARGLMQIRARDGAWRLS